MTSQKDSGSSGGATCENCGETFDPRGLPAHQRACDGGRSGDDADTGGRSAELPIPTEEAFYREHGGWLAVAVKAPERDGASDAERAARTAARRTDADKREAFRQIFGVCPAHDCENGKNGFGADGCAQHPDGGETRDAETADNGGESDDGDGLANLIAQLMADGYGADEAAEKARELTS